jgi:hypothetical protein
MGKIYQIATKLSNGHKIYQMVVLYSKWPQKIPTFFISRPPKIHPNLDFGLKTYHLATLNINFATNIAAAHVSKYWTQPYDI